MPSRQRNKRNKRIRWNVALRDGFGISDRSGARKEREKGLASCSKEDSEPLCHSSALQSHMQCNKGSIIGPPLPNCRYNSPEGTERAVDARVDK